jgi:hypothetical protein
MNFIFEETALWGWVVLTVCGIIVLAKLPWSARRMRDTVVVVCLFGVAFGWQQIMQPVNFGVAYGHIRAQGGDIEAFILHNGVMTYYLVVRRTDGQITIWLPGYPTRIFWIQDGKTIGVEGDRHLIVDIEILADPNINRRPLSAEEERRYDYRRRLTPEEEQTFRTAEQRANGR